MKAVRISAGAGYAGDRIEPALENIRRGNVDYIMFECLAERTIALAQKDRAADPQKGYNRLLEYRMERVLPLLRGHFCQRYANEQFFIYDRTHRELLLYANGRSRITQIENFQPVLPGEDELYFRSLWKQFFQSVAIRERENPRCQNTFMPKRYRGTMTEFLPLEYEKEQGASPKLPGASGTDG